MIIHSDEDDSRSEEIYRQTATHGAKEEKNVCDIGSGISSPDESEERYKLNFYKISYHP